MEKGKNVHGQETEGLRAGVAVDVASLGTYLEGRTPFKGPWAIKQFKLGQSNPTFLMIASNGKCVVRKKPPGSLLSKTAHAIEREYLVLDSLKKHSDVPVPQVYFLCEDHSVLGTPFYTMEFLQGRIFPDNVLPTVPEGERKSYYQSIIRTLVKLHSVDFVKAGLGSYGRQGGYYGRQVDSLVRLSEVQANVTGKDHSKVGPLHRVKELSAWFASHQVQDQVTLVHGDYKTDNIVFHPTQGEVIGLLDWELSTIGHPYSDLANLLLPWYTPYNSNMKLFSGFAGAPRPLPVPEADELIELYCRLRNLPFPIPNWNFCIAFAFFRLSVIAQGIAARVKRNQASSGFAGDVAKMFLPVSQLACHYAFDKGSTAPAKL
ncbi:hypothetical protein HDU91_004729 [Kappamyces sp. JEL0680]|nr:hypothetical protein HDU91_004729 [Kappamyces sp. JEL0680]